MEYKILVTGGTFDHFHKGHEAFLGAQLAASEKVLIGITSDSFITPMKKDTIEPYETRVAQVEKFLRKNNLLERVEIEKIESVYIPAKWKSYPIEAIAVTEDAQVGGEKINIQRQKEGLAVLPFLTIPYVLAEDRNRISSSRIRKGEINREGTLVVHPVWLQQTMILPEDMREKLSKPFGTLLPTIDPPVLEEMDPKFVISIGDVVTHALQERKFGQKISIVDLFVQRKQYYTNISQHMFDEDQHIITVDNPAGSITPQLFFAIKAAVFDTGRFVLSITGEEDLAVLPSILLAPLNFHIIYGQPDEGIVVIRVDEEAKQRAADILQKFTYLASK